MDDDQYNSNNENNNNSNSDDEICKVYDKEDLFTLSVQIVLALMALLSLWFKRQQERPRRTFSTWCLDISKQAIGACYAHVLNMIIASVISQNSRGDSVLEDQCAWYGLSYLIDTTLGLVLAVCGLRIIDKCAHQRDWAHLKHNGVYDGDDGWFWHWSSQCVAWLFILTVCKMIIYLFMWVCSEPLAWMGTILFAPFQGYKHVELLFVMIFFPGFLNVIYFWIADGYLKASSEHAGAHENDDSGFSEEKKVALMEDVAESELKICNPPWSAIGTVRTTTTPSGTEEQEGGAKPAVSAAVV